LAQETLGQNWLHFHAGDRVTVAEFGNAPYEATVVLTSEIGVLWVLPDTGSGRKVFDSREQVVIRHCGWPSDDDTA
jgi:peptide methionine sulfoxide reductase MsrB